MPLNPDLIPAPAGSYVMTGQSTNGVPQVVQATHVYQNHWATCPNSNQFRRDKKAEVTRA